MSAVKDDLLKAIQSNLAKAGIEVTKTDAETVLKATCTAVVETAKDFGSVRTLMGVFTWKNVPARDRRNPRSGDQVHVEEYDTLKFKASRKIRNGDFSGEDEADTEVEVESTPVSAAATRVPPRPAPSTARPPIAAKPPAPQVVRK